MGPADPPLAISEQARFSRSFKMIGLAVEMPDHAQSCLKKFQFEA
jgi:hypothetical protein